MGELLNIKINDTEINVEKGTLLREIAEKYQADFKYPILAAEVNNQLQELHYKVISDCTVKFLDITSQNGFRIYQRSVVFLMIYATKEILGKQTRVVVEHSISKNYYCQIIEKDFKITAELLAKIEEKMHETAGKNLPLEKFSIVIDEGIKLSKEFGLLDKVSFLKYRRTANVNFYKLDWFYDYFYGQMAPNTGCLTKFKLVLDNNGFMLLFPSSSNPDVLSEHKHLKKITQVFNESNKWARILKTDTVGALNDKICAGERGNIIRISEGFHEKKLANIADLIYLQNKNVVLIAGPSSSGKTTFAERLCIQLRVTGLQPHVISLDNYYVNREFTPRDEFGEYDFESLEAIDIVQFNKDLSELLDGKTVQIPHFNFISGKREYKGRFLKLEENDVLVIEGIHGLNEKLTYNIPRENKFKIFISALTQLNIDDHNRIPTTDTRLIRRMVRDSQFRGFDAKRTIGMWESVTRGEQKYIFPFQEDADAIFNSALLYELCVLKQFAEPLLFNIDKSEPEFTEAKRLVKFLDCFIGIPSDEIPNNSILREFIGGSCFRT